MTRSPARRSASGRSPHEEVTAILNAAIDVADIKREAWVASMLVRLDLSARSYVSRWLSGEQQVPLAAICASVEEYPELVEHVARVLAGRVGKVLADEPRITDTLNDFHAFATLGASAGRVLDVVARMLEDGVIDAAERQQAIVALEALGERVQSLLVRLRSTSDERVEGIRLARPAPRSRR